MNKNFKFHNCNLDSEVISLEKRLEISDKSVYKRWMIEKDSVAKELQKRYLEAFPDAAADPVLHVNQCLKFVAKILNDDHKLSSQELFLLMYAMYIHDMGMVSRHPPYKPISPSNKHYEESEAIALHGTFVNLTKGERKIVGYLCRWHNKEMFIISKGSIQEITKQHDVRIYLLLAIMHLCDDFHKLVDILFFVDRE